MTIAEMIKQARENLGLTQEDLAEKCEVSRQAVSKWELGASVPSPENLKLLEEVLEVSFPAPEEPGLPTAAASEEDPEAPAKAPFWSWERAALLAFGVLIVSALFSAALFTALRSGETADAPRHAEPYITGIYFFSEDAGPLYPDLGDGWNSLTAGKRVLVAVTFEEGTEDTVDAVSLFLTPTGTETLQYREQIAVQAAGEGRDFALFAWDIPQEGLMGHLEVVLECGGNQIVADTLNVTAPPSLPEASGTPGTLTLSSSEIHAAAGDRGHYILEAYGGAPFAEVEWSSSDPSVARVANTGTVFIEGPGEAVVTASWKGQTAECRVYVEPAPTGEDRGEIISDYTTADPDEMIAFGGQHDYYEPWAGAVGEEGNTDLDNPKPVYTPVDGISYEPAALTIPIGATLFMDESDEPFMLLRASGAPGEEIVWTSLDPAVVEVSDTGALLPVSPGEAVVTAAWKDQTAECRVEVYTGTVPTEVPGVSKVVR